MIRDHLGNTFKSKADMARHYGLSRDCLWDRLDKGWNLEKALTTKAKETKIEFEGVVYPSKKALCADLGITYSTLIQRTYSHPKEGLYKSILHILCKGDKYHPKILYKGKRYKSLYSMCKDNGLNYMHALKIEEQNEDYEKIRLTRKKKQELGIED